MSIPKSSKHGAPLVSSSQDGTVEPQAEPIISGVALSAAKLDPSYRQTHMYDMIWQLV